MDRDRIVDTLNAGAIGYLLKDSEPEELIRGIHAAARGESPLDPRAARAMLTAQRTPSPLDTLTERERQVLTLVADGLPNKQIARRLEITEKTVKAHLTNVFRTIGVDDLGSDHVLVSRCSSKRRQSMPIQGGAPQGPRLQRDLAIAAAIGSHSSLASLRELTRALGRPSRRGRSVFRLDRGCGCVHGGPGVRPVYG